MKLNGKSEPLLKVWKGGHHHTILTTYIAGNIVQSRFGNVIQINR